MHPEKPVSVKCFSRENFRKREIKTWRRAASSTISDAIRDKTLMSNFINIDLVAIDWNMLNEISIQV